MSELLLSDVAVGEKVCLTSIKGDTGLMKRLLSYGLNIGTEVVLLQRYAGGVVMAKDGNRVALGHDLAKRLLVTRLNS